MSVNGRAILITATAGFPLGLLSASFAADTVDETDSVSVTAPLAERSLLLDGVRADGRLVVVGERGHVLLSDDEGHSWRQVVTPTVATLTGVTFHDANTGWAVGHDAVILRTNDGGDTWELVYSSPEDDTPFLDVWFKDADNGLAIGAYGYFYETNDGGGSWTARVFEAEDLSVDTEQEAVDEAEEMADDFAFDEGEEALVSDLHLNHISRAADGTLYIAAEAGFVFRSDDGGETWVVLSPPYEGSFYATMPLADESVLVFGLRGHVYRSDDRGESWEAVETDSEAILMGSTRLADERIVLAGLAGTLLVSTDGGQSFELRQQPDRMGIATVIPVADETLVLVGEAGVRRLELSD